MRALLDRIEEQVLIVGYQIICYYPGPVGSLFCSIRLSLMSSRTALHSEIEFLLRVTLGNRAPFGDFFITRMEAWPDTLRLQ